MGVETAMAVGSIAASGIGAAASFTQARKQKELMKDAQREAEQAMADARAKLDVNYYEQLAIPMQAYEREREALISQGAQAIQAGVESERGAAATAGRIQMAQSEAQAGQREAMAKELAGLQKLTAEEESRLTGLKADLDISQATAARQEERDAQRARARAMQQGFASVASAVQTAAPLINLYPNKGETAFPESMTSIQGSVSSPTNTNLKQTTSQLPTVDGFNLEDIKNMSSEEYNNYINSLSPEDRSKLSDYILSMSKGMNFFSID
jgi:hypothetical protein